MKRTRSFACRVGEYCKNLKRSFSDSKENSEILHPIFSLPMELLQKIFSLLESDLLRLTCSYQTIHEKIIFLGQCLSKHMFNRESASIILNSNHNIKKNNDRTFKEKSHECQFTCAKCPALYLFGYFLKHFIHGWSEENTKCAFHDLVRICFNANFWQKITNLLNHKPGQFPEEELIIRLFLRRIFLDPIAVPQIANCKTLTYNTQFKRFERLNYLRVDSNLTPLSFDNPHTIFPSKLDLSMFSSTIDSNASSSSFNSTDLIFNASNNSKFILNDTMSEFSTKSYISRTPNKEDMNGTIGSLSDFLPSSTPLVNHKRSSDISYYSIPETVIWPASKPLKYFLQSYSIKYQARILFILYGPIHKGRLMWKTMCENTAADIDQLNACFGDIGAVVCNMFQSESWTPQETISILDQLTRLPDDWLAENVACLLYTSGSSVASLSIVHKAENARTTELAVTLTSLCLIQVKIRANLTELIELVDKACKATGDNHRTGFLDQLARSFQDVIVDLYETDDLEDRIEDFSTILRAQAEFMRALMARMYENNRE